MEIPKKESGGTQESTRFEGEPLLPPPPPPPPFSAERERQELSSVFSQQSHSSHPPIPPVLPTPQGSNTSDSRDFIPVAIPINEDASREGHVARMATVTAVAVAVEQKVSFEANDHKKAFLKADSKMKDDEILVEPLDDAVDNDDTDDNAAILPPSIPPPSVPLDFHRQDNAAQLRAAQHRAKILTEEERVGIERAQRERNAIQYHSREALRMANEVAVRKAGAWDEGLAMDARKHLPHCGGRVQDQKEEEDGGLYGIRNSRNGERGYQVAEYEVAEYDFGDYDVSEYKSVYD